MLFQIPIDIFEEPWVIFRGKDGQPGCVQNTCAHRACPLHLGSVTEGRIQCPYHGKLEKNIHISLDQNLLVPSVGALKLKICT